MLTLPAMPSCFWSVPPLALSSQLLNNSCVACAIHLRVWYVRVHEACIQARAIAYDLPRRLPRLARTEVVSFLYGWIAMMHSTTLCTYTCLYKYSLVFE